MRREYWIYLGLALVTAGIFWPVIHCEFINLDDWMYVTANSEVRKGLTWETVSWAFGSVAVTSNWHPLTWLSHMLDYQLFGLNAGGHHVVNVIFHGANTLLLLRVLREMTREIWPSVVVAVLFALHPLHVESVAWISERKDVLSTFFGLLTIWAYARYTGRGRTRSMLNVQGPSARVQCSAVNGRHSAEYYVLALLFFALGLMSKPMLVTWPFVLLLLDWWPLGRVPGFQIRVLGFSFGVAGSHVAQLAGEEELATGGKPERWLRLILEKVPFLGMSIAASAVAVLAQGAGKSIVGLIPFSGRLDNALISYVRYLYKTIWPQDLAVFYPHPIIWGDGQALGAGALLVVITVLVALQVKQRPYVVMGWLWFMGTLVPVIGLVQVGAQAMADRYMYIPSIGLFIIVAWGFKEVAARFPRARLVVVAVFGVAVLGCVAVTGVQLRHWRSSETLFGHALEVTTRNMAAEFLYGDALIKVRKVDEGIVHLENALRLNPKYAAAHGRLAGLFERRGRYREAIAHYQAILETEPDQVQVLNNLAWMLATNPEAGVRNGQEAVRLAERACTLSGYKMTICVGTLASAYAEAGRFPEAIATAEKARALAIASGQQELAEKNSKLLELYRRGEAYRETPPPPVVPSRKGAPGS